MIPSYAGVIMAFLLVIVIGAVSLMETAGGLGWIGSIAVVSSIAAIIAALDELKAPEHLERLAAMLWAQAWRALHTAEHDASA
jgi:hypothetical protein